MLLSFSREVGRNFKQGETKIHFLSSRLPQIDLFSPRNKMNNYVTEKKMTSECIKRKNRIAQISFDLAFFACFNYVNESLCIRVHLKVRDYRVSQKKVPTFENS